MKYVLNDLASIDDNALILPRLKYAYSNTKTDLAREWAGLMLLRWGDFSKADAALKDLMTPGIDHPFLFESFAYGGDLAGLKYLLPLAKSQNVFVRRNLAGMVRDAMGQHELVPGAEGSRDIIATAAFELEKDPDKRVHEIAMDGICDVIDNCKAHMGLPETATFKDMLQNRVGIAKLAAELTASPSSPNR